MNKPTNFWNKLSKLNKIIVVSLAGTIAILTLISLADDVLHILKTVIQDIKLNTGSEGGGS